MHSLVPPKDHVRPSFPRISERKGWGRVLVTHNASYNCPGSTGRGFEVANQPEVFFPGKNRGDEFVAVYRRGGMRLLKIQTHSNEGGSHGMELLRRKAWE